MSGNLMLELATGVGKTYLSLLPTQSDSSVLYVVQNLLQKRTVLDEVKKFNLVNNLVFTHYNSLYKFSGEFFNTIILDEADVLFNGDTRLENLADIKTDRYILTCAELDAAQRKMVDYQFNPSHLKITLKDAIKWNILAEPEIILLNIDLDNSKKDITYVKGLKRSPERRDFRNFDYCYTGEFIVSEMEANDAYNKEIELLKKECLEKNWPDYLKIALSRKGLQRKKFLSLVKSKRIKDLLLEKRAIVIFASQVEANEFGNSIVSGKSEKENQRLIDAFNSGELNYLSACTKLDRGQNLKNCDLGIFCSIDTKSINLTQRLGRILRSENPFIIIPIVSGGKDETLVINYLRRKGLFYTQHEFEEFRTGM